MLAGLVQAPSRLAPTHNLARGPEAQPAGAAGDGRHRRDHAKRGRATCGSARPVWQVVEGADRHLFRRLGRAGRAGGVRGGFRRSEGADDARPRPAADRGARGQPGQRRRCAGGAGRDAPRRAGGRDGRRQELQGIAVQPRHPGAAPAGIGVQAVRLSRRASRRLDARQHHRGRADHDRRLDPGQQRRRLSRRDHLARGVRPVEQCGDGALVGGGRARQRDPRGARPRHHHAAAEQPQPRARHRRASACSS